MPDQFEYAVSYPLYLEDGAPQDMVECDDLPRAKKMLNWFNSRILGRGWTPPAGEEPRIVYRVIPEWQDFKE